MSRDEYLAAFAHVLSTGGGPDFRLGQSILGLADADEDGRIAEREHLAFLGAYGVADAAARESFRRLDQDGDGFIGKDEFMQGAQDCFLGDDAAAPGTWLFGPLPA